MVGPLGAALPDVYTWARHQATKALEAAAEEEPQAITEVVPDLVELLIAFEGLPDGLDFTTTHEVEGYVRNAFAALEAVAEVDPESVLAAFESRGGIDSVEVPGWSDRLSELGTTLESR